MEFETVEKFGESIVIEKKSKFLGKAFYIEDKEEAEKIIEDIKKKHYDARHNCYAYRILEKSNILEKQTDDGEPSGTAGSPMLSILQKRNLVNVLVVVTRYFGGILLGTGGLVKAYSDTTICAIENANVVKKEEGYIAEITLEYSKQNEFEYICEQNKINIISKEYTDKIRNIIEVSKEKYNEIFINGFQNIPITLKENKYITKALKYNKIQ